MLRIVGEVPGTFLWAPSKQMIKAMPVPAFRISFNGSSILCRSDSVGLAILFSLGAQIHQPAYGLLDAESPIKCHHAKGKIRTANIRASVCVIRRSRLQAAIVVRQFSGTYRSFTPAGNTKGQRWQFPD